MIDAQPSNPFTNAKIVGENVSGADYRKNVERGDPAYVMSRSDLMEFAWCPARWIAGYDDDGSKSTEWGSLMDTLLLDREHFDDIYQVAPKMYPVDVAFGEKIPEGTVWKPWTFQANYCKAWKKKHANKQVVAEDGKHGLNQALEALEVLQSKDWLIVLLQDAKRQVMVVGEYRDEKTKIVVPVKALIDIAPPVKSPDYGCMLDDFKTCTSAATGPWGRAVKEHDYHVQAAMYLHLWNAATGEDRNTFGHVLQENYAPWQSEPAMLSAEFLMLGYDKYIRALKHYAACLASDTWPGYAGVDEGNQILPGWRVIDIELWMINKE